MISIGKTVVACCDSVPDATTEGLIDTFGFSAYWPDDYLTISDSQASYYYNSQPDFMLTWPFLANQDNPAKDRWDAGGTKTVFAGFDDYQPPPVENIGISIDSVYVYLEWDSVSGATSYKVYSSNNPYADFVVDTTGTFIGTSWSTNISENKKFYDVRAVISDVADKKLRNKN